MPSFTKDAIKNSFIRLLNEKPLKQITVRDIVEDCGINRNSFYYHFADIPTLLEEIITEEARRIITAHPDIGSVEECLRTVMEFAMQNKRAIMHIYNSVRRSMYEQYLWQVSEEVVRIYAKQLLKNQPVLESDRNLIVHFYKCVCFGLVTDWIRTGMKPEVEADLHRLCELKKGMAEAMIARCTETPEA
ncbi:MAG: TetR/AcrR family transcriptional regulator [Oscillospiraceae bacterium]|nr:TetR/AcrR family transcriptional regulator [Oscillospiraceae bacterium]